MRHEFFFKPFFAQRILFLGRAYSQYFSLDYCGAAVTMDVVKGMKKVWNAYKDEVVE